MSIAERLIQEGMEKGVIVGRQEGIHVGRQEGIHVGRQEGIHVGRQEGIHVGRQEAMHLGINLVLAVFDKFGQSSKSKLIVSMIKDIHDPAMLNKLEKDLKNNKTIDDFQKIVEELSGK